MERLVRMKDAVKDFFTPPPSVFRENDIPAGWEGRTTPDGKVFFTDVISGASTWRHPCTGKLLRVVGDLPPNWKRTVRNGEPVFKERVSKLTTRTDPRIGTAIQRTDSLGNMKFRFDCRSTALQVLDCFDLRDNIAVITGANTGIGFETARSLALHDCHVVFACRSEEKAGLAIKKIKREYRWASCDFIPLDLTCLNSVREFAREFKRKYEFLSILVLNAAVFAIPHTVTEDGYETTFQVCHLGHFYLTLLLSDEIIADTFSRIVVLSCSSHKYSVLPFRDLNETTLSPTPEKYCSLMAYWNAKMCNVLFAMELSRRWKGYCFVYVADPGDFVDTDLSRNWWLSRCLFKACKPFSKTLQEAASTPVFCASSRSMFGYTGLYLRDCQPASASLFAANIGMAAKLWECSEDMLLKAKTLQQL